jgi:hypothetical protein
MIQAFKYLDYIIEHYSVQTYFGVLFVLHIAYVLIFFNIMTFNETILNYTNVAIQIFISTVLFIRFNPWRKVELTEYDKSIIFSTAIFLLSNLALTQYFLQYFKTIYDKEYQNKHIAGLLFK